MREIKFRAWNGKNIIGASSVRANGSLALRDGLSDKDLLVIPTPKYEVMQYTGLKDIINKNEVYEHDIINLLGIGFLKVEWDFRDTGWVCLDKHYKKRNLAEVLLNGGIRAGNIYENPDLLKG